MLNNNDWIFLNEIVYLINSTEDIEEMQKTFLELMQTLIPYDKASFFLSDVAGNSLTKPVGINFRQEVLRNYIDIGKEIDYTKWMMQCAKSMVYKESDLKPFSYRKDTAYYKLFYMPNNLHFSLQVTFAFQRKFLGVASFFRNSKQTDFSDAEVYILELLKNHISYRLYSEEQKNKLNQPIDGNKINLDLFMNKYSLTNRESEVFKMLAEGCSNEDICKLLFISKHTVKKHTLNIYKKLDVKTRLQLFQFVREINVKEED